MTTKIGIDARLAAYRTGGIASYTMSLITALAPVIAARGWELVAYRARHGERLPGVARQPALQTPPHHRWEQAALPLELLWTRPAMLHSPDFIPPRRWPGRCVITVHDLDFLRTPERLTGASRRYYGQINWAVQRAEAIIAVSTATKRDVLTLTDADERRITVIHEAADPLYRPDDAAPPPTDDPYFLFVGTIEPRKNIDTLLDAYAAYRAAADHPARLVVIGAEGWRSAETVGRLRDAPGVEWRGPATPAELLPAYRHATALVLPSWYEGFGLPVVEAMACGTPVVVSDTPALREIAADAALVASPDDPGAWTAALRALAERPEMRREYRARGLERATAFSWTKAARETAALYARVLAAPRRVGWKEREWRRTR